MANQSEPRSNPDTLTKGVVPYIQVEGAVAAIDFYKRAFGAREISRAANDDGSKIINCQLEINGGLLMVMDAMPEHGFPLQPSHSYTMQLLVPDGQAWFDRAVEAGCKVTSPFQKMFWGDLWGSVMDPFGIRWGVDQPANG
ncbi:MAG TPA: glyoxalase/bleomycin resistance/extradiol dioxygenase family protein [Caulobacteraceae bacterium]|jgi:PhnB protein|nr:glyoxalase/bleomycin resistance/extradiol dioxygenase family protein [Caulobacteraceae bacterium]